MSMIMATFFQSDFIQNHLQGGLLPFTSGAAHAMIVGRPHLLRAGAYPAPAVPAGCGGITWSASRILGFDEDLTRVA
jgi:hypothetical protein